MKKIIELLNKNKEISAYRIEENSTDSIELFYVLDKLETNRATNTKSYVVTIYKDYKDFRGSSSFTLFGFEAEEEIEQKIKNALYSASFVENKFYELPKDVNNVEFELKTNMKDKPLIDFSKEVVDAIFAANHYENGWINSTEIFLKHRSIHLVNSQNVDVSYDKYSLMVEVIPTWSNGKEEFELYKAFETGTLDIKKITQEVEEILELAKARSEAKEIIPNLSCKVILQENEVVSLIYPFVSDLTYSAVFNHMALFSVGDLVQGDGVTGDKLDIELNPVIEGSINSSPVDGDGVLLKKVKIIENGVAKRMHGDSRFGYYLNEKEITGTIRNISVACGSKSFEEMKKEPYVLCSKFSAFQVDYHNGYFGGEVRLGFYFDGEQIIPVSGFSISGDFNKFKKNMVLSSDKTIINGYEGPKYVEIKDMKIL